MSLRPDIAAVLDGDSDGCVVCGDSLSIMADMPPSSVNLANLNALEGKQT